MVSQRNVKPHGFADRIQYNRSCMLLQGKSSQYTLGIYLCSKHCPNRFFLNMHSQHILQRKRTTNIRMHNNNRFRITLENSIPKQI
jgi:hypothetical protein